MTDGPMNAREIIRRSCTPSSGDATVPSQGSLPPTATRAVRRQTPTRSSLPPRLPVHAFHPLGTRRGHHRRDHRPLPHLGHPSWTPRPEADHGRPSATIRWARADLTTAMTCPARLHFPLDQIVRKTPQVPEADTAVLRRTLSAVERAINKPSSESRISRGLVAVLVCPFGFAVCSRRALTSPG